MVALIPFRKGSKRVLEKSVRQFDRNGEKKPLFVHTVKQAVDCSELFEAVIIASDYSSSFIFNVLVQYDLEQVYIHTRQDVADSQPASDYIKDIIKTYKYDSKQDVCLLQPTCPLRSYLDIYEAVNRYYEFKARNKTLVSISDVGLDKKFYTRDEDSISAVVAGTGLAIDEKNIKTERVYKRNSSIYIFNVGHFNEHNTIFEQHPSHYLMPMHRSIDIDTEEDFKMAEYVSKFGDRL